MTGKLLTCSCCKSFMGVGLASRVGFLVCDSCVRDYFEAQNKDGNADRTERLRAALSHAGALAEEMAGAE